MMKLGKKYTYNDIVTYTCVGFKLDGTPIVEWNNQISSVSLNLGWREVLEPKELIMAFNTHNNLVGYWTNEAEYLNWKTNARYQHKVMKMREVVEDQVGK